MEDNAEVQVVLSEYQIADMSDKAESKKWRIALYIIVGITTTALIISSFIVHNMLY